MAISRATELAMRARFGKILMSDACQRINFFWGHLHADGSAFCFVALALASQPPRGIGVDVRSHPRPGAAAVYNSGANKFVVPSTTYPSNAFERMTIVHEATHAIQDATLSNRTLVELDETAAFVAGALFNIYSAPNLDGPYPFTPTPGGIYDTAHKVARQIADTRGYALMPDTASPLRQAIMAHPTYAFRKQTPRYVNNGVSL